MGSTQTTFNSGASLEFFIDSKAVDLSILNQSNDFCLARANSDNEWECTDDELT